MADEQNSYKLLQVLLAKRLWQEADWETASLLKVEKKKADEGGEAKISTDVRKAIDKLWIESSNGRFGFSVQSQLLKSVDNDIERLGDMVGWRTQGKWLKTDEITFSDYAPIGHLPAMGRFSVPVDLSVTPVEDIGFLLEKRYPSLFKSSNYDAKYVDDHDSLIDYMIDIAGLGDMEGISIMP